MADLILDPDSDDQTLLNQIVDFYHRTLKGHTAALDFLRGRGVTSTEAIDHFRLGFCDRSLGRHVPDKNDDRGRRIRDRLERLGLVHGRGHEYFTNLVVCPIPTTDGSGRIVDLYGRRIFDNRHRRIPTHKHLNVSKPGVWNMEGFAANGDLILCSSLFDALAFWNAGHRHVTCTFGSDTLPADHLTALQNFHIQRVLTPCPGLGVKLREAGLDCYFLRFPTGLDACAFALQTDNPAEGLGNILRDAERLDAATVASVLPAMPEPEKADHQPVEEDEGEEDEEKDAPSQRVEAGPLLNPQADDQKLLAQVVDYYHQTLTQTQQALDYLTRRGITNAQAVTAFRLGFADRSLGLKLPSKATQKGQAIRSRLQQIGLFRESGHEHFRGSITVPICAADGTGQIVDIYGRKVQGEHLRKGTAIHTHLNDQKKGVWNIDVFGAVEEVVLCGSLWDALAFWNHGYRNATTMFGPDALTDELLAAFAEFQIKRVLTTCEKVTDKLQAAGLEVFLVKLPLDTDVNAFARQVRDPADALGSLLRGAEWVGKGQPSSTVTVPITLEQPTQADTLAGVVNNEAEDDADDIETEGDGGVEGDHQTEERHNDPTTPIIRTASPLPPAPTDVDAEVGDDEVVVTFGNRRYRVRGLSRNTGLDVLRVNVLVSTERAMFVDTFDLYSARHRKSFQEQAATELGVEEATIKKDLGRVLLQVEDVQDANFQALAKPKEPIPEMSGEEEEQALRLLRDPELAQRIVADFAVVGERTNKLVGYLAAVSRKLDQPLAVIIQSTSAAGKTTLMESILSFVPPEEVVKFSAMTGQSLYYMGEDNLKNKILAIVEEEGAQRASYALKLLQSEGELRIASTGKEVATGRLVTQEYVVEGPVMIFLTTTSIQVDEELMNRCLVLTVDEDRQQTRHIHQLQRLRQTLDGQLAARTQERTLKLHRNAQRLLKPLLVANPYAERLTFLDNKTRTRRDHLKYLTLIRTITLLHQHQRPVKTVEHHGQAVQYIEVTLEDIALANELATEVLGRSLDDLPPQTRRLLDLIDDMVTQACRRQGLDRADFRFSRREVREFTAWGNTQLKVHLKRLEELEYLLVHRDRDSRRHAYELLYQQPAQDGDKALAGLIDVERLRQAEWSGPSEHRSGDGRPEVGSKSGQGRVGATDASADEIKDNHHHQVDGVETVNSASEAACAS